MGLEGAWSRDVQAQMDVTPGRAWRWSRASGLPLVCAG